MAKQREQQDNNRFNRRSFIKGSAVAGGAAVLATVLGGPQVPQLGNLWHDDLRGGGQDWGDYDATSVIYTMCEQCNSHCSLKAVIREKPAGSEGPYTCLVAKLAGNPYSPLNMQPFGQIPYNTPPAKAALPSGDVAAQGRGMRGGRTCLKGQAGIQTAYDAARLRTPLKRVGPRGSGQWQSISWEQAIGEIVEGSLDLGTPGLKSAWAYVEEGKVMADWEKVKSGEMSQAEFDGLYRDVLIDTRHPDLGPKANQIVGLGGNRRNFFQNRFWPKSLGSVNAFNHGGICGQSGVVGNARSFTAPRPKQRMFADFPGAEFVIVWGTDPLVSNRGPTWLAPMLTNALARGMKLAVVDPRLSKVAEKAHMWVPIQPGTDAALALGMARWIIENHRYDERYLKNPNQQAAEQDGEPTWSDATHLINVDQKAMPKLRASDLGLGSDQQFVVLESGNPAPHDAAMDGDLEVDTVINGIRVKSVFTLFKERVMEKTLEQYAELCRIDVQQIIDLAREFTSHGKKAAITSYRGPAMHGNGYYNVRAINCLNHLIGNYDWKGGSMTGGAAFRPVKGIYDLEAVPGGLNAWGVPITREKAVYEKTSLFTRDGYPARRPWYSFPGNMIQEVLPSAADGYPYPIKALFVHRHSLTLSVPAGWLQEELLKNTQVVPLLVVFDVVMSETASCADYVLPDLTYLERWGFEDIFPNFHLKESHFMQPVTRVYPEPRAVEDVLIEIGKRMGLPGVGANAFPGGSSLNRAEDFYLKLVANIAHDGQPVPDAGEEEMRVFVETRQKALGETFDLKAWQQAVKPEEWRKVVYVLNRGGRFEPQGNEYQGDYLKYRLAGQVNFYDEGVAKGKNSYSGEFFDGLPRIAPVAYYNGKPVDSDYPLALIDWKARHLGTHRTISSPWLREIEAENLLWIHPADAQPRGIKNGDRVKIKSSIYEVEGVALVTQGIKPGVVGSCYNYGHTAYGARPHTVDGKPAAGIPHYGHVEWAAKSDNAGYAGPRDAGFAANHLQMVDPVLKNSCVNDPIGGSASQFDTRVEVVKA
ncbi:MAG: molybdopterin-dependent oxidoreductase [Bacillota bacterium]